MKKINILIILGLFVLLVGIVQPAHAIEPEHKPWTTTYWPMAGDGNLVSKSVQLNAAASKFEGLLKAYSSTNLKGNGWPEVNFDLFTSSADNLITSLEEFNAALEEIYPTLAEKEQIAVREAYSSLGLYLEDFVTRTNSVFGREVFWIELVESEAGLLHHFNTMEVRD